MTLSRAVSLPAITSGSSQDFTDSELSSVSCGLVFASFANTGASPVDDAQICVGTFKNTGGTVQNASAATSEDGGASSDNYRISQDDNVVWLLDPADGTDYGKATVTFEPSSGVRLNWSDLPTAAVEITVLMFDSVANVSCGTHTTGAGDLALGFVPDVIFWHHTQSAFTATGSAAHCVMNFGATSYDGTTIRNRCSMIGEKDNSGDGTPLSVFSTDTDGAIGYNLNAGAGTIISIHTVDDIDVSGNVDVQSSGGTATFGYVAIELDGDQGAYCDDYVSPTSATKLALDGPSWTAQAAVIVQMRITPSNTDGIQSDLDAGAISIGAASVGSGTLPSGGTRLGVMAMRIDEGSDPVDTASLSSDTLVVHCPQDNTGTGADLQAASFQGETNDGASIIYTEVDTGQARQLWAVLIEEEPPAAGQKFMMQTMAG